VGLPPDTVGGQGLPVGDIPGVEELPCPFPLPVVDGDGVVELGLLEPGLLEPGLLEPELLDPVLLEPESLEFGLPDPASGVDPLGALAVPGKVPHGEPLGGVPGAFGVFGLIVEGCVLLPGVAGFGEVDPGTEPVGGVTDPVGGGVAVLGVWVCPPVAGAPAGGGVPPEGVLCPTIQVAQNRSTERRVSFRADIFVKPPALDFPGRSQPKSSTLIFKIDSQSA
jgi:hypothetical protein